MKQGQEDRTKLSFWQGQVGEASCFMERTLLLPYSPTFFSTTTTPFISHMQSNVFSFVLHHV